MEGHRKGVLIKETKCPVRRRKERNRSSLQVGIERTELTIETRKFDKEVEVRLKRGVMKNEVRGGRER